MDNLEYFVQVAEQYKVKPFEVALKFGETLNSLFDEHPDMRVDWYLFEAKKELNEYYKKLKGVGAEQ